MEKVTVLELLNAGWDWYKKYFWLVIGVCLTLLVLNTISASTGLIENPTPLVAWSLLGVTALLFIAATILSMGQYMIYLKISKDGEAKYTDLFKTYKPFFAYVIMGILVGVLIALGLLFFIVPGIWAMAAFLFAPYFVLERNLGPIEAMKRSVEATREQRWVLCLWSLLILAVLAAFFGVIYALDLPIIIFSILSGLLIAPIFGLGSVYAYRKLVKSEETPSA